MTNTNYTTRGEQIVLHNLRMFLQIQGWGVKLALVLTLVLTLVYTWLATNAERVLLSQVSSINAAPPIRDGAVHHGLSRHWLLKLPYSARLPP